MYVSTILCVCVCAHDSVCVCVCVCVCAHDSMCVVCEYMGEGEELECE